MSTTQTNISRVKFATARFEIAASPVTHGIQQTLCLLSISLAIAHHRFRLHFRPLFILRVGQVMRERPSYLTCHLLSLLTKHPQTSLDIHKQFSTRNIALLLMTNHQMHKSWWPSGEVNLQLNHRRFWDTFWR